MPSSNFVDYVKIFGRSGKGGPGSRHFRREKFIEFGGPDGGDGGNGGSIVLRGNSQYWTLIHLKYKRHIFGEDGEAGSGARCSGKNGTDVVINVPLGTVARDAETGEIVCEVTEDGQEAVLLKGGRGGLGNWHFKTGDQPGSAVCATGRGLRRRMVHPRTESACRRRLVGFPNAGKSTLLAAVSAAKPKIANYAFTTLEPNLGIVECRDHKSFVMADIPGIIEGAHTGKGLGTRFLRHIERNSILLFMIPADTKDVREEYRILLNELEQYNPELLDKQRLLAITKSDLLDEELQEAIAADLPDIPSIFISSVSGYHIRQLKDMLWEALQRDNQ